MIFWRQIGNLPRISAIILKMCFNTM